MSIDPHIGRCQVGTGLVCAQNIPVVFWPQQVGGQRLHGRHHVLVKQAIPQAYLQRRIGVHGNQHLAGAGVVALQVFDDDAGFCNWLPVVHQQRHLAGGPEGQKRRALGRIAQVQQVFVGIDTHGVKRNKHFLAIGRKWVVVQGECIHSVLRVLGHG